MKVILGAGIAGLATGYRLLQNGKGPVTVIEQNPFVGGMSRTVQHGLYRFDTGPHRFYTRDRAVYDFVHGIMGDDLVELKRSTKIHFRGKYVSYPLTPADGLRQLGPAWSARAFASFLRGQKLPPVTGEATFEDWGLRQFGRVAYEAFFKVYSEKVWGRPCTEISADFADERIGGASMISAIRKALFPEQKGPESFVSSFVGVRNGYGRISERMADAIGRENSVRLSTKAVEVRTKAGRVRSVVIESGEERTEIACSHLFGTIPVDVLLRILSPAPPEEIRALAGRLRFRNIVLVFTAIDRPQATKHHWVYYPSPEICFCRIHEPRNWFAEMAPEGKTGLVAELFCSPGDSTWTATDSELVDRVAADYARLDICGRTEIITSKVIRIPRAYPVYYPGYRSDVEKIMGWLKSIDGLWCLGRGGRYEYASSDHYIAQGLAAADGTV